MDSIRSDCRIDSPGEVPQESVLKDEYKVQRKRFANWTRKKFRKEDTMRIFFSDEKMFDLDGIYHSENDRIWSVNREEANWSGGKNSKESLQEKL